MKQKLEALKKLSNSRFLQGSLLNALQQTYVDNVRLTRISVEEKCSLKEGTPAQKSSKGTIPATAGTVTQKIIVLLDARDSSVNAGDSVNKMKDAVANQSYFKAMLNKTNGVQLVNLSAPQLNADGKPYVLFSLECNFPEVTR